MKANKLDCCIVRDLLPSYIEGLTEPGTSEQVSAHLDECAACKQLEHDMRTQIPAESVPKKSLRFLKKVQRTRLLAAVLAFVVTLLFVWWLYDLQFHYANTESGRLDAIQDFVWDEEQIWASFEEDEEYRINRGTPVHIVAYQQRDDLLFVSFTVEDSLNSRGVMQLNRGINGKYRLVSGEYSVNEPETDILYSSYLYGDESGMLYTLAGYNSGDTSSVQIAYSYQNPDGSQESGTKRIPMAGSNFLRLWSEEELTAALGIEQYEPYTFEICDLVLLDSNGKIIADTTESGTLWSVGLEDTTLLTYLFMIAAGIFGIIFIVQILRKP
ncbi:zf-HC2 domain-containing protein [Butyricicoccus sp.]|uniref:zf-HC2 domain-containing protein n=1 Tax=Butyricicoccus sp. TaxID=2049021 RepID=UPI003F164330